MLFKKQILGTVAYLGGLPSVLEEFCWAWGQLVQYNTEYLCIDGQIIDYQRSTVSYHSYARNKLADECRGDWLVMVDTDHQFEPDTVARLLMLAMTHKVDAITAVYVNKFKPHPPVLYMFNKFTKLFEPIAKWDGNGANLIKIDSAGAGTLFVRKSLFQRVKDEFKCQPFDPIDKYGEDHSFFYRLMKLKIGFYVAPMIESNHLAIQPLSMADFDPSSLPISDRKEVGGFK